MKNWQLRILVRAISLLAKTIPGSRVAWIHQIDELCEEIDKHEERE